MLKKTFMAGAVAAVIGLPGVVFAQAAPADAKSADAKPAEPKPPYTLTGNFGFFSQYIFRGLSQTDAKPAAQGGFDWAHESGFYLGTWASNISWPKENFSLHQPFGPALPNVIQGSYESGGSLEWDFYGGYKWNLPNDFTVDLGTLYYWYPGNTNQFINAAAANLPSLAKLDTWEIYAAGSWKWITLKYSYSVLDHIFGVLNSRGTGYLDLSANVPLGEMSKGLDGLTLNLHVGYQKYTGTSPQNASVGGVVQSNDALFSYKDAKIGLSYALPKDFTVGAFWSKGFSYNKLGYGGVNDPVAGSFGPYPHDIAKSTGTVFIQKTF